ncbi:MAG: SAM-dependent methyltransferase [Chryseotalea sp. WA131a]|nr:MAG: SAM-dependent methyltransferase [Chryseotalea sp. WA131a]
MNGKLFLIPNLIAEGTQQVIPPSVLEALPSLQYFLAEDVRTARRFLSGLKIYERIESLQFEVLNKDTTQVGLVELMKPLLEGKNVGVISESGCPGVADPGALAVAYAHQHGIQVVPLVGPSSILLALMASGLNGQRFAFHGYLPIDAKEAVKTIKELEKESQQKKQTQLFIETPYRNNQVLDHLLNSLKNETQLSIALDVTGIHEFIQTKSVGQWKKNKPALLKEPAVFSFLG